MKKVILLFLVVFFCFSCKTLLTTDIRARIVAEDIPIDKVQFYNTKKIVLFREIRASKGEALKHGKVRFVNGKYYEFLKFKKNTPCICVSDSANNLSVSFEEGSTIKFGNEKKHFYLSSDNDYYKADRSGMILSFPYYQIYADSWNLGKSYYVSYTEVQDTRIGKVTYNDSTYYIIEGKNAKLSLKKSQLDNLNYKHRTVKGIKVE